MRLPIQHLGNCEGCRPEGPAIGRKALAASEASSPPPLRSPPTSAASASTQASGLARRCTASAPAEATSAVVCKAAARPCRETSSAASFEVLLTAVVGSWGGRLPKRARRLRKTAHSSRSCDPPPSGLGGRDSGNSRRSACTRRERPFGSFIRRRNTSSPLPPSSRTGVPGRRRLETSPCMRTCRRLSRCAASSGSACFAAACRNIRSMSSTSSRRDMQSSIIIRAASLGSCSRRRCAAAVFAPGSRSGFPGKDTSMSCFGWWMSAMMTFPRPSKGTTKGADSLARSCGAVSRISDGAKSSALQPLLYLAR
mmetsp:Transcript_11986/g.28427  ORF Transcript_11986/g.28427 Transcript_11986/m.28427 type:complete len:311 (-) Transcript_11986:244-1176(-)